ncbi:iron ABC transporter permease [Roseovarius sp. MMSF_3281]|uniref:FecCD family ABC transporter permease n=1 Tax=Roseovarius sp. MMSF_3281 TaxID=3046694 RepID=UPI00273EBA74|nr:iron ABC transporter permease [Roseovarius sp. MMSF_3281]
MKLRLWSILLPGALALLALSLWALTVGASDMGWSEAYKALIADGSDRANLVMQEVRLPRLLAGLLTGAALAVAGAIIQGMTGNPLADPGLLGVNAGAAFAVVCGIAFLGIDAMAALVWLAFLGAALAAALVLALGSAGRSGARSPVRLILAGVIVASFIGALTAAILVLDTQTQDVVRQWTVGSLHGRTLDVVLPLVPYVAFPMGLALVLSGQVTALSLGAEVAQSIGQAQTLWRLASATLVVALAGAAAALAGPLSFVGLWCAFRSGRITGASCRLRHWPVPR